MAGEYVEVIETITVRFRKTIVISHDGKFLNNIGIDKILKLGKILLH
jgi:hypothetical protein